jgi:hypothetical protein
MTTDLDGAARAIARRGYDVTRPADRGQPDAVATPTADARPLAEGDWQPPDDRPVALERVGEADPTTVLERVAGAARAGNHCLFVADPDTAEAIVDVLAEPAGLVRRTGEGYRTFYPSHDRVPVDGGYAACRVTLPSFRWEEEPTPETRLVLYDGLQPLAAIDGVAALASPPAEAFPFVYRRGGDKRIHVSNGERPVGTFSSISEMKRAGYAPVPAPLVPEHVFDGPADGPGDDWAVAVVEGGELLEVVTPGDRAGGRD